MNAIVFTFITEISFVALTTAGGVNALAIQERSSQCVPYTALFDDIETNSAVLGNPVGVYHGINYTAFNVDAPCSGAQPKSPPNAIFASLPDQLLLGNLATSPFGTLTAGPGVWSFDLQEFVRVPVPNFKLPSGS